jgi:hypothetical protein
MAYREHVRFGVKGVKKIWGFTPIKLGVFISTRLDVKWKFKIRGIP